MLESVETHQVYPVLPMRDVVLFPTMVVPLFVGRMKSMLATEAAHQEYHQKIVLMTQKGAAENDPGSQDLYEVGVLAHVLQYLKLPDNTVKILVEAVEKVHVIRWIHEEPYLKAEVSSDAIDSLTEREQEILVKLLLQQFEQYSRLNKKINQEVLMRVQNSPDPQQMTYLISANLPIKTSEKQNLLELTTIKERVERLIAIIEAEVDLLQVEQRIRTKVKKQMEKTQREYYLNEQIKAIQDELGQQNQEIEVLRTKVQESQMSQEAKDKAIAEIERIKMMPLLSAEASIARNYVEALLDFPWNVKTKDKYDLKVASQKLDRAHDGLEKVKDRILEHLAVQKKAKKIRGPIICLVGPPGVGKTSLATSIAEAVSRKFIRIALGGVRDEAEIRGHRRTYLGAMPGKIIQKMTKVGVQNPVILLDEIDKMSQDFRGDPASALLEVLDPEQNQQFNDHYLDVDVDLSDVMFIATANSYQIPPALLDRLEVINLSGYTEDEKLQIAKNHLIPKLQTSHGLKPKEFQITDHAILSIIRHYTLEAGVRNLERELSKILRKVVKSSYTEEHHHVGKELSELSDIEKYLGSPKYRYYHEMTESRIGVVKGLAWTEVGGEQLIIETTIYPGKGKMTLTGKLGNIMQESIQAAYSVVRSRAPHWGVTANFFEEHDFHIHVPEGATPKDGPSAGITVCTGIVSSLMNIPVPPDIAMTGEITLRGDVLRIGGLKEKLLAARRSNMRLVLIPRDNEPDLRDIPANIRDAVTIRSVSRIEEVLEAVFGERWFVRAQPCEN